MTIWWWDEQACLARINSCLRVLHLKCDSVRDPLLISIRWLPIVMYRWKPLKLGFRVFQDTWNGWWQSLNVFLDWSQKMQANPSQYDLWAKCRKCSYGDGELGLRPFGGFLPSCVKSLVGRGPGSPSRLPPPVPLLHTCNRVHWVVNQENYSTNMHDNVGKYIWQLAQIHLTIKIKYKGIY